MSGNAYLCDQCGKAEKPGRATPGWCALYAVESADSAVYLCSVGCLSAYAQGRLDQEARDEAEFRVRRDAVERLSR